MLRQGPVPAFVHGVIEYVAGAVFILAPFLFGFDSGAAKAVSIVAGIAILVVTASSDLPTGLSRVIPINIHVVFDFLLAAILVASPFLFGFSHDDAAMVFFIALGVAHLLITIATRFLPARGERA
ncbi:MAG: hypothetical protein M3M94_00480 [Actinomycetota bacterium]|nr:hypothetical protein [Actinomycetota bacterium]